MKRKQGDVVGWSKNTHTGTFHLFYYCEGPPHYLRTVCEIWNMPVSRFCTPKQPRRPNKVCKICQLRAESRKEKE